MDWIDISIPLRSGMAVWPGDEPVRIEPAARIEDGGACNLTRLAMSAHTGTHIDAPRHFLRDGAGVEAMPLEAMTGRALVIGVDDETAVRACHIPPDLPPGARVLFRTRNSTRRAAEDSFREDFIYMEREAAARLAGLRAALAGIDYLSIGGFRHDLAATHEILLSAGVWILEGLRLERAEPGEYELLCLPLLIPGADGAPARALVRPLSRPGAA